MKRAILWNSFVLAFAFLQEIPGVEVPVDCVLVIGIAHQWTDTLCGLTFLEKSVIGQDPDYGVANRYIDRKKSSRTVEKRGFISYRSIEPVPDIISAVAVWTSCACDGTDVDHTSTDCTWDFW